ncbi:hypothetical protein [Azospirillum argentinense]
MASPSSTGGAGTHLESRIVACYLTSVLVGGAVRGLPDCTARSVRVQRAYEDEPLDDAIIEAEDADGLRTMRLQAKRSLTFGNNALFHEVMAQCWDTFKKAGFRHGRDRLGVAVGTTTGADDDRQSALQWARQSADAGDFFRRIAQPGLSNEPMRTFVQAIRDSLDRAAGSVVDEDTCWRFLRHFVLLHFDFEREAASRDRLHAVERLAHALAPSDADRATDLWQALVDKADGMKSAAGSVDRAALVEDLHARFVFAGERRFLPDLQRLAAESRQALDDIRLDIGGVFLARQSALDSLLRATADPAFLEIVGEAGCGKSGLLRLLAERIAAHSPTLILKAGRLPVDPGWPGFARHLGLVNDPSALLTELASGASPCLFIDGVDRLTRPGEWALVNDLLRAIARAPSAGRWSVVVTTRLNGLDDYREQLDPEALRSLRFRRVTVDALGSEEIALIVAAHPPLAPLIRDGGRARALAHRPYLLSRLLRTRGLPSVGGASAVTEIDLMRAMWADDGGQGAPLRRRRQDALLELGRRRMDAPGRPVRSVGVDAEALQALVADDIIREDPVARTVDFVHDIIEDWVLCLLLEFAGDGLAGELAAAGQPLWLLESIRILGAWRLERSPDAAEWQTLLDTLSAPPLEPRWRRTALLAPLRSTRVAELLTRVEPALLANDAALLQELMVALRTVEVVPNPLYLDAEVTPGIDPAARDVLAHHAAAPRAEAWAPFLAWLMPLLPEVPGALIDETSRALEVAPRALQAVDSRVLRLFRWDPVAVAAWADGWLSALETDHSDANTAGRARLGAVRARRHDDDGPADRLRYLLLSSAGGAPERVRSYLRSAVRRDAAEFVIRNANLLVPHLPADLVDFLLAAMRRDIPEDGFGRGHRTVWHEFGIEHDHMFFPPSHVWPPFLHLLRSHPEEGLRLVNGLCNHAAAMWRLRHEERGALSPVTIDFPWGKRAFWGHAQEYLWFRGGSAGPNAVMAALMALDAWMDEQIASGRDAETVFREALEGNDCVGALGACVAAALAHPDRAAPAVPPLLACPQIWEWDLHRWVGDRGANVNIMGRALHRMVLDPVAERNAQTHRRFDVRSLVPYCLFSEDDAVRTDLAERIRHAGGTAASGAGAGDAGEDIVPVRLQDTIRRMQAMADPASWSIQQAPRGSGIVLAYVPPADLAAAAEPVRREHERLNAMLRLSQWADASLEEGSPHPSIALPDALAEAKALDSPDLFATPFDVGDLAGTHCAAAVAGIAAVAVRSSAPSLGAADLAWCREILRRAAAMPVGDDEVRTPRSLVKHHPTAHAVAGLASLVAHGIADRDERERLLLQIAHPLRGIAGSVFLALRPLWESEPLLCWQAVALGMRLSVPRRAQRPTAYSVTRSDAAAQWVRGVLDDVIADFRAGRETPLPAVPSPWSRASPSGPTREAFRRSDTVFLWDFAPLVLFQQPLERMLADPWRRGEILQLVRDLAAWTVDECSPPETRHAGRGGAVPYEWVAGFMEWCAALGALAPNEVDITVVRPVQAAEEETALRLMGDYLRGFVAQRFHPDSPPDNGTASTWRALCDWVLAHRRAEWAGEKDYLDRDFGACVEAVLFSAHGHCAFETPWPGAAVFTGTLARWVDAFGTNPRAFRMLLTYLQGAGWSFLPQPGLAWLAGVIESKRSDAHFWTEHDNGDATARLIERSAEQHGGAIAGTPDLIARLVRATDILTANGVRRGALAQQQLAKLAVPPGRRTR